MKDKVIQNVGTKGHIDWGKPHDVSESSTNGLLCCPFCGGTDIDPAFARGYDGGDKSKPILSAGCFTCSSTGPDVPMPNGENGYKEATEAWNRRAT